MINDYTLIDNLQTNSECFFIDILPKRVQNKSYFELEDYLLENYLKKFSLKICMIIIKLIHYYTAKIYLTECTDEKLRDMVGNDLRGKELLYLKEIIQYVIEKDKFSVQIILSDVPFLISINGNFSVEIYNANAEQIDLIESLVKQENLFLHKAK
jgi:hypothetical protein